LDIIQNRIQVLCVDNRIKILYKEFEYCFLKNDAERWSRPLFSLFV